MWICRTRVKARYYSRKLSAMGTFYGAEVVRGADWQWANQDGMASHRSSSTIHVQYVYLCELGWLWFMPAYSGHVVYSHFGKW